MLDRHVVRQIGTQQLMAHFRTTRAWCGSPTVSQVGDSVNVFISCVDACRWTNQREFVELNELCARRMFGVRWVHSCRAYVHLNARPTCAYVVGTQQLLLPELDVRPKVGDSPISSPQGRLRR